MARLKHNNRGFTLIELILALSFFAFILLFAVAGFIQINRSYNKGITVKRIHEVGRLVIEDISRAVRVAPADAIAGNINDPLIKPGPGPNGYRRICTGDVRFGWNEQADTGSNRETYASSSKIINLVRSEGGVCDTKFQLDQSESYLDSPDDTIDDPNDVYGGVVVLDLNLNELGSNAIQIELILGSSDPLGDLIDASTNVCKGKLYEGDQFCDTVRLVTTVSLRS